LIISIVLTHQHYCPWKGTGSKTRQTASCSQKPLFYGQLAIAATNASSVVCGLYRGTKRIIVEDAKKLARSVFLAHLAALEGLPINQSNSDNGRMMIILLKKSRPPARTILHVHHHSYIC
jgi:hypothetical protein